MIDCVGANAASVHGQWPNVPLIAGYDTGGSFIQWSAAEWALWPPATHVHIDQGGNGSPVHSANVMDVEPGAWRPADVPGWVSRCTAPRPTVYCDRSDLPAVKAVFKGDIWLATLDGNIVTGPQIVACQYRTSGNYDESAVFDSSWPLKTAVTPPPVVPPVVPPTTEAAMIHGFLPGSAKARDYVPFAAGSFKVLYLMQDFTKGTQVVRVAYHTAGAGYTVVNQDLGKAASHPVALTLPPNCDGVDLVNEGTLPVGYTLA
jgi:hypothetical protein